MHDLFRQVLTNKDLSKAGDLFNVENEKIVADLSIVIGELEEIASGSEYLRNDNDQSVVEICITRVTSAIRETNTIEEHAPALVSLLKSCLDKNLVATGLRDEEPSHAKIAADVMSFVFLNYSKRTVMELALPVATNFLLCGNKEISGNLISYLALAAIDNAEVLARPDCMKTLVEAVVQGSHGLIRVLSKVQETQPSSLTTHAGELVSLLTHQLTTTDLTQLTQILTTLSQHDMQALSNQATTLVQSAVSKPDLRSPVLDLLVAIATVDASPLASHVREVLKAYYGSGDGGKGVARLLTAGGWTQGQLTDVYKRLIDEAKSAEDEDRPRYLALMAAVHKTSPVRVDSQSVIDYSQEQDLALAVIEQIKELFNSPPSRRSADALGIIEEEESSCGNTESPTHDKSPGKEFPASPEASAVEKPRDTVQHFCEKHLEKIKSYISKVMTSVPIPDKCSVSGSRAKKRFTLNFGCTGCSAHCLYRGNQFTVVTKLPQIWAHLIFLNEQSKSPCALNQEDPGILNVKQSWRECKLDVAMGSFTRLVTSSFPNAKDQESVIKELYGIRFFDLFEYNETQKQWVCFICNNPEKVGDLLQDGHPAMEGQLQEKKGKWRFFKRWKTRYFTLSGSQITYNKKDSCRSSLPVAKIQSVKALRKGTRDIPKAFEIFADNQTYVFKTKDGKAEQWVQCLQIALAQSHCEAGPSTK